MTIPTVRRCAWCESNDLLRAYHDEEWGMPTIDDRWLFEALTLEGFVAGLSWLTILRKRDHFRRVFDGFEIARVARYGAKDVERLLLEPGIVRHRGKIEATIGNAQRALELIDEQGSLHGYFWLFEPEDASGPRDGSPCAEAAALSKDLIKRGWRFVGPTTVYAFMQAAGLVNDHRSDCHARLPCLRARDRLGAAD